MFDFKLSVTCITPVADFKVSAMCISPFADHSWCSFHFCIRLPLFSPMFIIFLGRGQDNVRFFCGSFCLSMSLFFDILGNGYKSLVLPHKVSESLQLTSDAPKKVVDKLLHNLQLDDASLGDPKPETKK